MPVVIEERLLVGFVVVFPEHRRRFPHADGQSLLVGKSTTRKDGVSAPDHRAAGGARGTIDLPENPTVFRIVGTDFGRSAQENLIAPADRCDDGRRITRLHLPFGPPQLSSIVGRKSGEKTVSEKLGRDDDLFPVQGRARGIAVAIVAGVWSGIAVPEPLTLQGVGGEKDPVGVVKGDIDVLSIRCRRRGGGAIFPMEFGGHSALVHPLFPADASVGPGVGEQKLSVLARGRDEDEIPHHDRTRKSAPGNIGLPFHVLRLRPGQRRLRRTGGDTVAVGTAPLSPIGFVGKGWARREK